MNGTRLLLVRHGEQAHGGRFWQHACTGLTERGREQAEATAEALASSASAIDGVVSSIAARASQTAEIIASPLALGVERTCDLCEMHPGQAEGMTVEEMNAAFGPHFGMVPDAEHYPDWLPGAIDRLRKFADRWAGQSIVCVTHTAVLHASLFAFGDWTPESAPEVRFGNCSITEWISEAGIWSLERVNDGRHVPAARSNH